MKEGKKMKAYGIDYKVRGNERVYSTLIDAKDLASAKKKIGKKHGYKDSRMIQTLKVSVVGYY